MAVLCTAHSRWGMCQPLMANRQMMSLSSMWLAYLARLNIIRSKALLEGAALRTPIAVAQILKRRPTCRVLLSLHDLSVC